MALGDVLAEVNALLTGVGTSIGSEFVHEHNAPPNVTWEPMDDEFELGTPSSHRARFPASLGTRIAGVRCHIWTKAAQHDSVAELTATEAMIDRVLWAIRSVVTDTNLIVRGGTWKGQEGETLSQYGRGYELRLGIRLPICQPVADAPETVTPITNVDDIGGTMVFPNSEVSGTPAP